MTTFNTIDDAIKMLREPIPYTEPDEDLVQIADWLEELKDLREQYKNVSEAYMKCNLELFRLMKEREEE